MRKQMIAIQKWMVNFFPFSDIFSHSVPLQKELAVTLWMKLVYLECWASNHPFLGVDVA